MINNGKRADEPTRVGLIGLGAIGQSLVALANEWAPSELSIPVALVRNRDRPRDGDVTVVATVEELLRFKPEVVVEVAGHQALRQHGSAILALGIDLIVVSVGVLSSPEVERELRAAAVEGSARVRVASGAIGGLDAIKAASFGGLERVTHVTRKPATTLLPAEEAERLLEPIEVFSGFAREAVQRYPESVNVVAAVSLAGVGFDRTEVKIVADPTVTRNQHEVLAEGGFGTLLFRISNVSSERNPRTGRIVAMSILSQLLQRRAAIVVG